MAADVREVVVLDIHAPREINTDPFIHPGEYAGLCSAQHLVLIRIQVAWRNGLGENERSKCLQGSLDLVTVIRIPEGNSLIVCPCIAPEMRVPGAMPWMKQNVS